MTMLLATDENIRNLTQSDYAWLILFIVCTIGLLGWLWQSVRELEDQMRRVEQQLELLIKSLPPWLQDEIYRKTADPRDKGRD
jgi:hypothetical protein